MKNLDKNIKVVYKDPYQTKYSEMKSSRKLAIIILIALIVFTFLFSFNLLLLLPTLIFLGLCVFWYATPKGKEIIINKYYQNTYYDSLLELINEKQYYQLETTKDSDGKIKTKSVNYLDINFNQSLDRISVMIDKSNVRYRINHIEEELTRKLGLKLVNKIEKPDNTIYTFDLTPEAERLDIYTEHLQTDTIYLDSQTPWNYKKHPHMLIAGDTGSGKTMLMKSLIKSCVEMNGDIFIIDPKSSPDLMLLDDIFKDQVVSSPNKIAQLVNQVQKEMYRRNEETVEQSRLAGYEVNLNHRPLFLFFDEYAVTHSFDKKVFNEIQNSLQSLIYQARSANIHIILGMQRPDALILSGALRDQFSIRAVVGRMSPDGYSMMFPDTTKEQLDLLNQAQPGSGYIVTPNNPNPKFIHYPEIDSEANTYFANLIRYTKQKLEMKEV